MKECNLSPSIWYKKKFHTLHLIREEMEAGPKGPGPPHLLSQPLMEIKIHGTGRMLARSGLTLELGKNPSKALHLEMARVLGLGKTRERKSRKHLGASLVPKLGQMHIMHIIPVPDGIFESNMPTTRKPRKPGGSHLPPGVMWLRVPPGNPRSRGVRTPWEQVLQTPDSLLLPHMGTKRATRCTFVSTPPFMWWSPPKGNSEGMHHSQGST